MVEQLSLDFSVSAAVRHRKAVKAAEAEEAPTLFSSWVWSPNIDVHLHSADEAVAQIAGSEPERAHHFLAGLVGGIRVIKPRRVAFPAASLDRILHLRPPAQITLDAATAAVARALWAHKLGLKPLRVTRDGQRLFASSPRWSPGLRVKDAPWGAIATCVHLGLPLDVDPSAQKLFRKKLAASGAKLAVAGLAGSAVSLETTRPDMLESLNLPGLAYDGDPNTGRYKLPLLASEPLLRQPMIDVNPELAAAIRKATAPTKPLKNLPEGFPWTLYPFQAEDAGRAKRILETTGGVLLAGDMGSGKLQPVSSPVLTPTGWAQIGSLRTGDQVMGSDGKPHAVEGVYPQGEREIFRVTFSDGSSTLCGDEHLWTVQSPVMKKRGRGWKVLPLREIRAQLRDGAGNCRWYIPITEPIHFERGESLPLDPYVLGVLIGDGSYVDGGVGLTTADPFVAEEVGRLLPAAAAIRKTKDPRGYQYSIIRAGDSSTNPVAAALRELGMWGQRAWEKRLPERYQYAPAADRLALLQGLLDTDGGVACVSKPSSIEFTSTSEPLARSVVALVQSLGGTARIKSRFTTYTHKGEKKTGRESWRLSIALPNDISGFRLPRKREAYQARSKYGPTRAITNVEAVGTDECVCISVASPDQLYITDDYILTHNTTVSLALVADMDIWPLLVVCPLSAFSTWDRQLGQMGKSSYLATENPAKAWKAIEEGDHDAVVISFDRVSAFVELVERKSFKGIIADEIQRIRTPGSKRSRALRALASAVPYRMGLSGTPLTNTTADVLPLGAFLAPGEWRPRANAKDLEDMYPGDPVEGVAEHLGALMVRRRIDQVGQEMAKRADHRVYIQLTPEQRRALNELEEEAKAAKEEGAFDDNSGRMHAFARLQKMRQIVNSPSAAGVPGPNPKVSAAIDMAKEFLAMKRKGVIFCADRTTFRDIGKALDSEGIGWVGIWGSTPPADRIENERRFHAGDPAPNGHPTDVVLCTIQAGAESWSASPTGTWLISTAYVYAPSTLAQMEARVHRLSSLVDGPQIEIMYIHAQGFGGQDSLDDRMVEILAVKQQLFAQVVDRQSHVDKTNISYSMQDLVFLMTGQRDEKKVAADKDAKAAIAKAQEKKDHAKRTLYGHKARNKNNDALYQDDGAMSATLEEYRAAHRELDDVDDLDAMLDAADHLEDLAE